MPSCIVTWWTYFQGLLVIMACSTLMRDIWAGVRLTPEAEVNQRIRCWTKRANIWKWLKRSSCRSRTGAKSNTRPRWKRSRRNESNIRPIPHLSVSFKQTSKIGCVVNEVCQGKTCHSSTTPRTFFNPSMNLNIFHGQMSFISEEVQNIPKLTT